MALAARPVSAASQITGKVTSGHGAQGKKEQRARNKGTAESKLTQRSGSSGKALAVANYPKIDMDDISDLLTHLCDIAGKLSHTQLGSSGWLSGTLNIPLEYSPEVVAAHLASQQGLVFMKVYYVSTADYLEAAGVGVEGDDDGE